MEDAKKALADKVTQMNVDQATRNRLLKDALKNRLIVTLDHKIATLKSKYKDTQDKMVDRRNILID